MNLLIVDDEPIVVEGLAYGIEWSQMDITDVYKAYSPLEALEYFERYQVDILVTDYRMPEYTGAYLAETMRRRNPFSRAILISAYDDFEYAKRAMEAGVSQYILKPIDYQELKAAVKRAILEINREIESKNYLLGLEDACSCMLPLAREKMLNQIFTTEEYRNFSDIPPSLLSQFQIRFGEYGAFILIRGDSELSSEEGAFIRKVLLEEIPCMDENLLFTDSEGYLVAPVFFPGPEEAESFLKEAVLFTESIQKRIRIYTPNQISVYVSEAGEGLRRIRTLCRQLADRATVDKAMRIVPVVSYQREGEGEPPTATKIRALLEVHKEQMKLCDREKASQSLERILRAVEAVPGLFFECKYFFLAMYLECFSLFRLELSQFAEPAAEFFYRPDRLDSLQALREWCTRVESYIAEQVEKKSVGISNSIILQAKRIVQECAYQDITLTYVAGRLYLHPNYLSRLFKEYENINFSDYVIMVKMEKAKELLAESREKIYDIAEKIGYRSVPHFNTIFKKVVGMTPKEYRDQAYMQKNNS